MRQLIIAAAFLVAGPASADSFGGFAEDESTYLEGRDRICAPISGTQVAPNCRRANAAEVAKAKFKPGIRQSGAASYRASASGTKIELRAPSAAKVIRTFAATSVVSRVTAVYASKRGRIVAVEYQHRFAGRVRTSVVAFVLKTAPSKSPTGATPPKASGTGKVIVGRLDRDGPIAKVLRAGRRDLAKRRYKQALAKFKKAEGIDAKDPEAVYGVAAAQAGLKNKSAALAKLKALGAMDHVEVPVWLVAARSERAFAGLRGDMGFRRILGLDKGSRVLTAYEKVVGLGGAWEQAGTNCAAPKVALKLDRKKHRFRLTIVGSCNGDVQTTRLKGGWTTRGGGLLTLVFPNPGADDEELKCKVSACGDGSGENCVACALDPESAFTLRATRR